MRFGPVRIRQPNVVRSLIRIPAHKGEALAVRRKAHGWTRGAIYELLFDASQYRDLISSEGAAKVSALVEINRLAVRGNSHPSVNGILGRQNLQVRRVGHHPQPE